MHDVENESKKCAGEKTMTLLSIFGGVDRRCRSIPTEYTFDKLLKRVSLLLATGFFPYYCHGQSSHSPVCGNGDNSTRQPEKATTRREYQ